MIDLMKEMKELQNKAHRYDNLKQRFDEYAERIDRAMQILAEVKNDLNPTINMGRTNNARYDYSTVLKDAWGWLNTGNEISSDWFEKQGLNSSQITVAIGKVSRFKGIDKRRDGRKVFYFLKKEI
jgi:hypothetical protein